MSTREALRKLTELSASQWGMFTTAHAAAHGVSRLDLVRLADSGDMVRLAHGVYRDAGAPSDEYEQLRTAWLSTDPSRLAEERLNDRAAGVIISGTSAAWLHQVGDLVTAPNEFTAAIRRQSQRPEIRYRQRQLANADVTIVNGLPATTLERTIADLVEARTDLSLVADVLSDTARKNRLDLDRLAALLSPLAARNGLPRSDGAALLGRLTELAGLDPSSLAQQIASSPGLGELVAAEYLKGIDLSGLFWTDAWQHAVHPVNEQIARVMHEVAGRHLEGINLAISKSMAAAVDASGVNEIFSQIASLQAKQHGPVMDALHQIGKNQSKALSSSSIPTPQMIALAQAARSTATGARKHDETDVDHE